jgi:hypothetical protein
MTNKSNKRKIFLVEVQNGELHAPQICASLEEAQNILKETVEFLVKHLSKDTSLYYDVEYIIGKDFAYLTAKAKNGCNFLSFAWRIFNANVNNNKYAVFEYFSGLIKSPEFFVTGEQAMAKIQDKCINIAGEIPESLELSTDVVKLYPYCWRIYRIGD